MRWRRDTLTAAERRRLADRDIDVAKLTAALAERTRALAERVTRVVGDGDTAAAAERCITGSGCAPRAVA